MVGGPVISTLRTRYDDAKAIVKRHFHDQGISAPDGLIIDIVRALGAAELRGFSECMAFFEHPASNAANDDCSPELNG